MATTFPSTGRFFPVPDLIGFQAKDAIEALRADGFTPVAFPHAVDSVSEAGFIVGSDPPPGSAIRSGGRVTLSVGSHPDFDWRASADVEATPATPTQLPLTWPYSAEPGLAKPEPEFDPRAVAEAPTPAANPGVTSAPASPSDAAFGERPLDAGSSRTDTTTPGAAAEAFFDNFSAAVPTPEDLDAWQRLRHSDSSSHADEQPAREADPELDSDDDSHIPFANAEVVDVQAERAAQERARREARRRSARRYRRLTTKQKVVIGGLLGLILLLVASAAGGHKPARGHHAHSTTTTTTAARTKAPSKAHKPVKKTVATAPPKKHNTVVVRHKPKHKTPVRRVVVIRNHTKVVTVTVASPTETPYIGSTGSYTPPASTDTRTSSPATTTTSPTTAHATTTTSSKPASTHATADKSSSGSGGGSALQSPTGATAPPSPTQP